MNREATAKDAGRTCPFCRFPLKTGMELTDCGVCSASHHAECWDENRGCAIALCAGGPGDEATTRPLPPPPPPQFQPPPPPPPPAAPSRTSVGLIAAIVALAVAVSGVAVAVVVTRSNDGAAAEGLAPEATPVAEAAPAETSTPEETATPEPTPEETATPEPTPRPRASNRAQIERILVAYYANVLEGDYDGAWQLLSPTYRAWKEAEGGGYAKWVTQEEVHNERLDPSGLHVEILSIDRDVATINVSGMSMVTRNDPNCDFNGVTWARRVDGKWRYDQGYLQNAARAAEWRPRREQTLGYVCESDGY